MAGPRARGSEAMAATEQIGSGYTVRQMTVEEAAEEIDAIVAAEAEQRGGPMPRHKGTAR